MTEKNPPHRPPIYGEKMEKTIVLRVPAWLYDTLKKVKAEYIRAILMREFMFTFNGKPVIPLNLRKAVKNESQSKSKPN